MTSIIHVAGLVKEFRTPKRAPGLVGGVRTLFTREQRTVRAVDGVSFDVAEGELVGYLGRNGAGKSTTVKLLTGILHPTSGQVEVAGLVPWRDRIRNAMNIGVVFGQRSQLWWDLPLIESLDLIGVMYRVERERYRRNLDRISALLDLGPFLSTPVRQLSLGQRMRGDLAAALLYEPRILYLDEPTVGLDVVAKERIRTFIAETNRADGTTAILTTHDMRDVERLCRRVIVIEEGRVLFDGAVAALVARYAPGRVLVLHLADGAPLPDLPGTELVRREGPQVWLRFDPARTPVAGLIAEATARYPVTDLAIEEPDLEQVVREIFEERGEAARAGAPLTP
ncbi:MAG TPA: ATP-binding cassette domain-containing protein [Candidatus Limnocylindria bacterium]|jgi:ABC-2 type transport system ATP-binding protein|nr:ATP-binding cassette domain-containing protein [Candidatus Limnocylindria bacterium]